MKPPPPSKAASAAVRAIWANLADRAGLECLGEVEQRTAQHMRKELAAIIDRQMGKATELLDALKQAAAAVQRCDYSKVSAVLFPYLPKS